DGNDQLSGLRIGHWKKTIVHGASVHRDTILTAVTCGSDTPQIKQLPAQPHQTLQVFSGGFTMGCPALHANAFANSGIFTTTPFMRFFAGECGSVITPARMSSGRSLAQSHCAKPIKNRCSGVRPSIGSRCLSLVAACHAM